MFPQENVRGLFSPLHLRVCETQLPTSPKVQHIVLTRDVRNTIGSWNARTWPRKPSNTLLTAADTPWDREQPWLARAWAYVLSVQHILLLLECWGGSHSLPWDLVFSSLECYSIQRTGWLQARHITLTTMPFPETDCGFLIIQRACHFLC